MRKHGWFEVDTEGLRELQAGKPKHHILRELLQNAWDENITVCRVNLTHANGEAVIIVEDDSPEGFRNLKDAFTLFRRSYKKTDPTKRGRFNIGEKQVIALCHYAHIRTTKGTVVFDKDGRKEQKAKRTVGSEVELHVKISKEEFQEILDAVQTYIPPPNTKTLLNEVEITSRPVHKTIAARLVSEIAGKDGILRRTIRKTEIWVHKKDGTAYLYEMGIPICKIDCEYSLNVQQKIPLSIDRETVSAAYLRDVFAATLNELHNEVEEVSSGWVREATRDETITKAALNSVLTKRHGEKFCVGPIPSTPTPTTKRFQLDML